MKLILQIISFKLPVSPFMFWIFGFYYIGNIFLMWNMKICLPLLQDPAQILLVSQGQVAHAVAKAISSAAVAVGLQNVSTGGAWKAHSTVRVVRLYPRCVKAWLSEPLVVRGARGANLTFAVSQGHPTPWEGQKPWGLWQPTFCEDKMFISRMKISLVQWYNILSPNHKKQSKEINQLGLMIS